MTVFHYFKSSQYSSLLHVVRADSTQKLCQESVRVQEQEILSDSLGCNDGELLICSDPAVFLVPSYLEKQDKCQHFARDVIRTHISVKSLLISLVPSLHARAER